MEHLLDSPEEQYTEPERHQYDRKADSAPGRFNGSVRLHAEINNTVRSFELRLAAPVMLAVTSKAVVV